MELQIPASLASYRAARAVRLGAAGVALVPPYSLARRRLALCSLGLCSLALSGLALWGLALPHRPVALAQGTTARLTASPESVAPNDSVTLTLSVSGVTDLAGFQAGIDWDEALVELEGVETTDWLGSTGRQIESIPARVTDHSIDFLIYTLPQPPGSSVPGVGGSGDLATLRFRAIAPGQAIIVLRQLLLTNTENEPIAVDLEAAEFAIVEPTPPPRSHIYLPYANRIR